MAGPVHYEIYVRRTAGAAWSLDCAVEERDLIHEIAETLLVEHRAAAVKATKETYNLATGCFDTVTLFSRGEVEIKRKNRAPVEAAGPLCVSPSDLYTAHARERIGRLLSGWLDRHAVTTFELLHRPDLVEQLEASGVEIQHALQKVAIPEAHARGASVHEVIRQMQGLVERAIARVMKDGAARAFTSFQLSSYAAEVERLSDHPDRLYLLGGGVARFVADTTDWRDKVERLIALAENAPTAGRGRALGLAVLEPALSESLGTAGGMADLFGADLELGAVLGALTCLAAPREAEAIRRLDAGVASALPVLTGVAGRLSALMALEAFDGVRAAIGKRVLEELNGPRRLHPEDPEREIVALRALAMVLTASAGRLLPLEDVQAAFLERSKRLVASNFVVAFLSAAVSEEGAAVAEARALVRLAENVVGAVNKRVAARWLASSLEALRFEKDVRSARETPAVRLAALAELHRAIGVVGLTAKETAALQARIGQCGGWVEADARLCALLAGSPAPVPARCSALAGLALGETAPLGPAADRARAELVRLMRDGENRAALAAAPQVAARVRSAMAARPPPPEPSLSDIEAA